MSVQCSIPQVGNWQGGSIPGQIQTTQQPASWPNAMQIAAARNLPIRQVRQVTVDSPAPLNYLTKPQSVAGPMRRNSWTRSYRPLLIENKVEPDQLGNMSNESGNLNHENHEGAHMYRPMQSDLNGWAGLRQHAFAQTFGGMTDSGAVNDASGGGIWPPNPDAGYDGRSLILTPPAIPRPSTTGIRSISGVTARGQFGQASNRRITAIFIPSSL